MNHCLGNRIRQLRKQKGFTLEELGEKADICCKYIGEIERGEKNPTVAVLQKIALSLEADMTLLLSNPEIEGENFVRIASINRILCRRDNKTLQKVYDVMKIIFEEKA